MKPYYTLLPTGWRLITSRKKGTNVVVSTQA